MVLKLHSCRILQHPMQVETPKRYLSFPCWFICCRLIIERLVDCRKRPRDFPCCFSAKSWYACSCSTKLAALDRWIILHETVPIVYGSFSFADGKLQIHGSCCSWGATSWSWPAGLRPVMSGWNPSDLQLLPSSVCRICAPHPPSVLPMLTSLFCRGRIKNQASNELG
jgi:hypothetical protein